MAGSTSEIVYVDDLQGLLDAAPGLALVCAGPDEALETARAFAARPDAPPLTLLVGSGETHPHSRLLEAAVRERRDQERQSRAARLDDIRQLSAGVAHELNTPLASIALRAESLSKRAQDPSLRAIDAFERFPRHLETIQEDAFRCKKIIGSLLDFARGRPAEVRDVDLNDLSRKAVASFQDRVQAEQLELSLRLDPDLPPIRADEGQLREAVVALVTNALEGTSRGGHVALETRRRDEGAVSLTVSDDGVGIPAENLQRIFSPFFTTKPAGKGSGLGLAVCHGVAVSHGGEIEVDSEPNRGTSISFVLPIQTDETS